MSSPTVKPTLLDQRDAALLPWFQDRSCSLNSKLGQHANEEAGRHRGANEAQIRLAILIKRCGHTQDQSIGFCSPGKFNGGLKDLILPCSSDALPVNVLYVALALIDGIGLGLINIKPSTR